MSWNHCNWLPMLETRAFMWGVITLAWHVHWFVRLVWLLNLIDIGDTTNIKERCCSSISEFESTSCAHSYWSPMYSNEIHLESSKLLALSYPCNYVLDNNQNIWLDLLLWLTLLCIIVFCIIHTQNKMHLTWWLCN